VEKTSKQKRRAAITWWRTEMQRAEEFLDERKRGKEGYVKNVPSQAIKQRPKLVEVLRDLSNLY
jgi:hypothetical protein